MNNINNDKNKLIALNIGGNNIHFLSDTTTLQYTKNLTF